MRWGKYILINAGFHVFMKDIGRENIVLDAQFGVSEKKFDSENEGYIDIE
jgi:hypothetical protein